MIARGAPPERVRVFANTVDVDDFGAQADRARGRRDRSSGARSARRPTMSSCSRVARLAPEKGLDVLVRAVAAADDPRLVLVVAGEGPERARARARSRAELGVRLVLIGDVDWERIVELYVAADVFALLSEREPWAVVVNEAAACGLPLVLSDRVGAAHDLLRDGENGALVPAGDVDAAARRSASSPRDPELRRAQGARSRELARDWGYGPSVEGFLDAVREAVARSKLACIACRGRRILVLNQYYWPGVEATAHLLTELCEALAEDYDVEVVTGVLHGHEDEPRQIEHNGVRITRVASTSYERSELGRRAVNYVSYLGSALRHALTRPCARSRALHDRPADHRRSRRARREARRRARARHQPGRLPGDRDRARPAPQPGGDRRPPRPRRRVPAARRPDRRDRGDDARAARGEGRSARAAARDPELGRHARDHAAAARQRVGARSTISSDGSSSCTRATSGTRRISTASSARRRSSATATTSRSSSQASGRDTARWSRSRGGSRSTRPCASCPYQKRERLPLSLSSADVHVVGLAKGLAGYVVPSRLYGILSAGRPVIVAAEDTSETARLVREIGCGIVIPPARPDLLARTIREAADGAFDLDGDGSARPRVRRGGGGSRRRDGAVSRARPGDARRVIARASLLGLARRARLDARGLPGRDGSARTHAAATRAQGRADAVRRARRVGARRGGGDPPARRERARARLSG